MSATENLARYWEFLYPWFERLRWRLRPHFDPRHDRRSSHPVRVGLDVADWWISVDVTEEDELEGYETTVKSLREALLIVGAFARINRVFCWQFLQVVSKFERAPWMDLDDPAFYPQFVVDFAKANRGFGVRKIKMVNTAIDGLLCGAHSGESEEFLRHWARVLAMCDRMGWKLVRRDPVALRVLVNLETVDEDNYIQYCHKVTEGIRRIEGDGGVDDHFASEGVVTGPRFNVTEMDLYLDEIQWSADTIQALQQLVDVQIPLHIVQLPTFELPDGGEVCGECRLAWCNFLRSLTGHIDKPTASITTRRVRRMVVPPQYDQEPLRSSLFSALVGTTGIQELEFKRAFRSDAQAPFWTWLASVVFSTPSGSTGIETLSISNDIISTRAIETLGRYRSLHYLAVTVVDPNIQVTMNKEKMMHHQFMIESGAYLDIHENWLKTVRIHTKTPLAATAIYESEDGEKAWCLVPGIGICSTRQTSPSPELSVDSMTTGPQSTLVNLRLDVSTSRHMFEQERLGQVVEVLGGEQVRGLRVDFPLDGSTLLGMLQKCPNLESLAIATTPGTSFRTLLHAIEDACPVTVRSLHLLNVGRRDLHETERLLDALKSPSSSVAKAIDRVCLTATDDIGVRTGRHRIVPPPPASINFHQLITEVLRKNHLLTHFWCLSNTSQSLVSWAVERHHGQLLTKIGPRAMERSAVLAFLFVLYQQSEAQDRQERLDDDVKAHILSFAAEPRRRSVLCEDPFEPEQRPPDAT